MQLYDQECSKIGTKKARIDCIGRVFSSTASTDSRISMKRRFRNPFVIWQRGFDRMQALGTGRSMPSAILLI
jgi:hypothetical protein